jgi:predicted O-methyltransferase YrrM
MQFPMDPRRVRSGVAATDRFLDDGYDRVVGMSSRFAAAVTAGLMRIQTEAGVSGPIAEFGTFEGRFFIALGHALAPGEIAVGIDTFEWPNPQVIERFERNCREHGLVLERRVTWKADTGRMLPAELLAKLGGRKARLIHIDGEHTQAALTKDLELAAAVLADDGVLVLDDMLHPGYPTLIAAVTQFLARHDEFTVLAIIDRETIVAATKLMLCRQGSFKRYEARLLEVFKDNVWPMGATYEMAGAEPLWRLVLSLDTRLAAIE